MTDWQKRELSTARDLVQHGSQTLRGGQTGAAESAFLEAGAVLDMSPSAGDEVLELRAQLLNELGVLYQRTDDIETSKSYHRQSLAICRDLLDRDVEFRSNAAATYLNLSSVISSTGDLVEARQLNDRAIELIESLQADGDESITSLAVGAHQNMALLYGQNDRFEQAAEHLQEAVSLATDMSDGGDPASLPQATQACQRLSVMGFEAGRHQQALQWGQQAERLAEDAYQAIGQEVLSIYVVSQINLISYNEQLNHFAAAEDALWKGLQVSNNHADILHRGVAFYKNARRQADARLEAGNLPRDEVEEGHQDLQAIIKDMGGLPEPNRSND